jgi:hypothetical protein
VLRGQKSSSLELDDDGKGIQREVSQCPSDLFLSTKESGAGSACRRPRVCLRSTETHRWYQTRRGGSPPFGVVLRGEMMDTARYANYGAYL